MSHDDVLVLVYSGSYSAAVALRARLDEKGIRSSLDDIPLGSDGQPDSRIYVALGDVPRALPLVAEFRTAKP